MKQYDTCIARSKGPGSGEGQPKKKIKPIFNISEVTTSTTSLTSSKNIQRFFITWKAEYWHSRPSTVWKLTFYFQSSSKPVLLKLKGT